MAFGRAFTLVFFLASSGFGAVLHICVIDASKCCGTSGSHLFQSLEEKDTKAQKAKVLAQLFSASVSSSPEHAGTRANRCLSEIASPRSVELYQLNATLLI
jgi:hypothetical protein